MPNVNGSVVRTCFSQFCGLGLEPQKIFLCRAHMFLPVTAQVWSRWFCPQHNVVCELFLTVEYVSGSAFFLISKLGHFLIQACIFIFSCLRESYILTWSGTQEPPWCHCYLNNAAKSRLCILIIHPSILLILKAKAKAVAEKGWLTALTQFLFYFT